MPQKNLSVVPDEIINSKIYVIRDKKVILDIQNAGDHNHSMFSKSER